MSTIYSVRQLTDVLRSKVESTFPFVWVRGEVSNLSRPSSGHIYFSLKDEYSLLKCVWFRGQNTRYDAFDPLTGEVFEEGQRPSMSTALCNGQQILCAGKISIYALSGQYQLIAEIVQDAGLGELMARFEKLKSFLGEKGYFDMARKRDLPPNPKKVAIITSITGAAIQDFLKIAHTRGSGAALHLYPVLVQGEFSAQSIVTAIEQINAENWAEVIVIIRGGGSLEDLWSFNEEAVAAAVFNSALPVLAGIGHEVDFSICDLTADFRAATPSHAAQLLWPEKAELMQKIDLYEIAIHDKYEVFILAQKVKIDALENALNYLSPVNSLQKISEKLCYQDNLLAYSFSYFLEKKSNQLEQGFNTLLRNADFIKYEYRLNFLKYLTEKLPRLGQKIYDVEKINTVTNSVSYNVNMLIDKKYTLLNELNTKLELLNPQSFLKRGHAFIQDANGLTLSSIRKLKVNDQLNVILQDGNLSVTVKKIMPS